LRIHRWGGSCVGRMRGSRAVSTSGRRRSLVRSRQASGTVLGQGRVQFGFLKVQSRGTVGAPNRAWSGYNSVFDNGRAVVHFCVGFGRGGGTDCGVHTGHRQDYFRVFKGRQKSAKRIAAGAQWGRAVKCLRHFGDLRWRYGHRPSPLRVPGG
jgi:hypothetical protein